MDKVCARAVGRIMVKAIEVNDKHEFSVFADYSGHCNLLEVSVRKGKMHPEYHEHLTHDVLYAGHYPPEVLEEKLNALYANLCYIHKTGKIPEGLLINAIFHEGSVKLA